MDEGKTCGTIYMVSPKPPVPIVAQREMVVKIFMMENGLGAGKHVTFAGSVDHPSKPVG